jgi:hypothetical protein
LQIIGHFQEFIQAALDRSLTHMGHSDLAEPMLIIPKLEEDTHLIDVPDKGLRFQSSH